MDDFHWTIAFCGRDAWGFVLWMRWKMTTIINFLWNAFKVLGLLCVDGIMVAFILSLVFDLADRILNGDDDDDRY